MLLRDKIWRLLWTCCLLVFYIVTCWARLWLLFASTLDRFLSTVSYFPSCVFLRRRYSFTSREILMFLVAIWSSLCFWSLMYRLLSSFVLLAPQVLNVALYVQVCWQCCALYMPLHGLVHKIFWPSRNLRSAFPYSGRRLSISNCSLTAFHAFANILL